MEGVPMRVVGKALLHSMFLGVGLILAASPEVSIEFFDQAGQQIAAVERGVPFQFQLRINGEVNYDRIELPNDTSSASFTSMGVSHSISQINGVVKRDITHRYRGRIDQLGQFQLMPIKLWDQQKLLGSYSAKIEVIERVATKVPYVQITTNQTSFYVGEQFEVRARFYYSANEQISSPQITLAQKTGELFEIEGASSPTFGTEVIDGKKLNFCDWQILVSAKEPGGQIFYPIELTFQQLDRASSMFIFKTFNTQNLFSNGLELEIKALPQTKLAVAAIGVFESFVMDVDRNQLADGQAAQLKLTLKGRGNWSKIKAPVLNSPESIQVYEGKSYHGDGQKSFEYVLQGREPGLVVLPAQQLIYFDVQAGKYKTIQTKSLELEILPNVTQSVQISQDALGLDQQNVGIIAPFLDDTDGLLRRTSYVLPIWLFGILAILPIGLLLIRSYEWSCLSKKRRIRLATRLNRNADIGELYSILLDVLAEKFEISKTQLNLEVIDLQLADLGVSVFERQKFRQFFADLQAAVFGKASQPDLSARLVEWLEFLEELQAYD